MINILIVDDEPNIVNVLKEYATYNDMLCDTAYDGEEAIELVQQNNYDCIVMDIMMPKLNGYETTKEIKNIKPIPIIMISAKGEEEDKLMGFEYGIDDYIVKPFSPKEVIARIKAVLKRTSNYSETFGFGNLQINLEARKVFVYGKEVTLNNKEFELLLFLVKNKGLILSRDKIINAVWSYDYPGDYRTIDTHIKMLRNHLEECGKYIKTVRGIGYKFEYEN